MASSYPHQSLVCRAITASLTLHPSGQSDAKGPTTVKRAGEGLRLLARVNLGFLRSEGQSQPG